MNEKDSCCGHKPKPACRQAGIAHSRFFRELGNGATAEVFRKEPILEQGVFLNGSLFERLNPLTPLPQRLEPIVEEKSESQFFKSGDAG